NLGWNVLMIDFRAHGKSEGNLTSIGYFEAKDVKAAYDFIAKQGEKNIVLWGISLGAATITKAISDYTTVQPAKVILEMPFATMLDATEGRVRMEGMPAEPISALVTFWGGIELGLWAFSNKPQEYARKINCPVLLQKGRLDIRVTDAEEQTLFNNIPAAQKKYVVYETAAHESLCKKEHDKWLQNVSSFLNN
ncbi:MAG TPA: alpha/beta hydrolase, partial [Chitinophagaceae bacterium]|nr:alpha/beta hydrolase [Chitinophagaceae bacterium]